MDSSGGEEQREPASDAGVPCQAGLCQGEDEDEDTDEDEDDVGIPCQGFR